MRGQDFRFLHSGPGDEFARPGGFAAVLPQNVVSDGFSPVIFEPRGPYRVFAYSDGGSSEPPLSVVGYDRSGRRVKAVLQMNEPPEYDSDGNLVRGVEPEDAEPSCAEFAEITEVTLDKGARHHITLFARDCGDRITRIAAYHPSVRVPVFRHYHIEGYPCDRPVEILAEVRVDPLPLVDGDDVLPFDGIEPIEYMILYSWKMKSSEVDAARKYKEEAAAWLKAQEVTDDTVQTSLVFNTPTLGTLGDVSMEAENI